MWVKCVSEIYLKDEEFWDHVPRLDSSWYWRRINKLKATIKQFVDSENKWKLTTSGQFTIQSYYLALQQRKPKIQMTKWNDQMDVGAIPSPQI